MFIYLPVVLKSCFATTMLKVCCAPLPDDVVKTPRLQKTTKFACETSSSYRLHYSERNYKLYLQQATNLSTLCWYNCVCHTDSLLLLNIFTHTKIKATSHHAKTNCLEDILRTYWEHLLRQYTMSASPLAANQLWWHSKSAQLVF